MRLLPWPRTPRQLEPPPQDPRPTRAALARLSEIRQELIDRAADVRRLIAQEQNEADGGT